MDLIRLIDLFGVAVFAISGALVAGRKQMDLFGVVGGVIRDLLAGEVPLILRQDLYATVAVVGAGLFELLVALGVPTPVAVWAGMLAALFLRLGAIRWHWGLPVFSWEDSAGSGG